jgi:predicted LPLAT superfamily acyltransferase
MLLLFCLRLIDGYHLYIEPFADRLDLPRGIREGALCETAARFAARLEYYCRQVPTQWFNFFPFWEPSNIHAHAGASAQRARGIVPRKDGTCGSPHA